MMTPLRGGPREKPRRALVTGGAVRVGRAIALALAGAGLDVVIGYHGSPGAATRTVRDLRRLGVRAAALRADLARPAGARGLVIRAARQLGGLDVLVNSAARFERTPLATTTPAQYDALLDLNLRGAFFCAQAAAALMGRGGRIVNIGDAGAARGWPGYIPYALSKAGVIALTRGLARALRPRGIAVNCVAPGAVLRPAGFPRARWRAVAGQHQGGPPEVAAAVVFFASCPASVTGQVLPVDGGENL